MLLNSALTFSMDAWAYRFSVILMFACPMMYCKSEIFHRVTSDGVYWFKDEEPYCMVSNRQKAVIWMILHTIMDAEYPIRYKGIPLNEKE